MKESKFYTVSSVAERFDVKDRTIRNWIGRGRLEVVELGNGRIRVTEEAIQKLVRPRTLKQTAQPPRSAEGVFVKPSAARKGR